MRRSTGADGGCRWDGELEPVDAAERQRRVSTTLAELVSMVGAALSGKLITLELFVVLDIESEQNYHSAPAGRPPGRQ